MLKLPEIKVGIVAVSRDVFPSLSPKREKNASSKNTAKGCITVPSSWKTKRTRSPRSKN